MSGFLCNAEALRDHPLIDAANRDKRSMWFARSVLKAFKKNQSVKVRLPKKLRESFGQAWMYGKILSFADLRKPHLTKNPYAKKYWAAIVQLENGSKITVFRKKNMKKSTPPKEIAVVTGEGAQNYDEFGSPIIITELEDNTTVVSTTPASPSEEEADINLSAYEVTNHGKTWSEWEEKFGDTSSDQPEESGPHFAQA